MTQMLQRDTSADPSRGPDPAAGGAWVGVIAALVGTGMICRLAQYLAQRSYWHDEAFLVLNLVAKDALGLMGPLDEVSHARQAAPPLFLLIQRGMVVALGNSELSLRFVPVVLGMASVALFALLAWRLLSPAAAAFAVALFALSDRLIAHSAEVKQYSGDVFVAVLLLLAGAGIRRMQTPPARLATAAGLAAVLLWLSHPAVFIFGAVSLALLPAVVRSGPRGLLKYLACNVPVLISFILLYFISIRVQRDPSLDEYWAHRFVDFSRPAELPLWLLRNVLKLWEYPFENGGLLLLGLSIAGVAGWRLASRVGWGSSPPSGRTAKANAAVMGPSLLLLPIGLTLLAAAVQKYPFGGHRLTLFLAPSIFLLSATGAQRLPALLGRRGTPVAVIVAAVLLVIGLGGAAYHLLYPRTRYHVRPAVEFIQALRQPNEGVYALKTEVLAYWPRPDPLLRMGMDPAEQIPFQRFWIVSSFSPRRGIEDGGIPEALAEAEAVAEVRASYITNLGGAAFLFEKTAASDSASIDRPLTGSAAE